jgi:hypothetical protein
MSSVAMLYNTLPNLGEAEKKLAGQQFDSVDLANLLAAYSYEFSIYLLVHAYCRLVEEEIMLANGNISEPKHVSGVDGYYSENRLASGETFEFRRSATKAPSPGVLAELNRLTKSIGVLEPCYISEVDPDKKLKYTDGRKDILWPFEEGHRGEDTTETGWAAIKGAPGILTCTINCNTRITRSSSVYKEYDYFIDLLRSQGQCFKTRHKIHEPWWPSLKAQICRSFGPYATD